MKPAAIAGIVLPLVLAGCHPGDKPAGKIGPMPATDSLQRERQITKAQHGHILTNTRVWSPDGEWIVYDVRSDAAAMSSTVRESRWSTCAQAKCASCTNRNMARGAVSPRFIPMK